MLNLRDRSEPKSVDKAGHFSLKFVEYTLNVELFNAHTFKVPGIGDNCCQCLQLIQSGHFGLLRLWFTHVECLFQICWFARKREIKLPIATKNTARRIELLLTTEQTGMKSIRSLSVTIIRRSIDAVANMYALHNTHYGNRTGISIWLPLTCRMRASMCAVIYCVAMTAMMFVCFRLVCDVEWKNSTSTFHFAWFSAHSNASSRIDGVFCALIWHSAHWTTNCHCAADGLLLNCQKQRTLVMERVR